MCGIGGFIATPNRGTSYSRDAFMESGIIMDTVRGEDSTGIMAGFYNTDIWWAKSACDGYQFVNRSHFKSFKRRVSNWAFFHNRAATSGQVTPENAHPFNVDHITLIHNGTLTDMDNLPIPYKQAPGDVIVDSHLIAYNLANAPEWFENTTTKDVIESIEGAFVLVWYDQNDDSINIVRNDERPLYVAMPKEEPTLFFMSERLMLLNCMSRGRSGYRLDGIEVAEVPTEKWYKYYPETPLEPEVTDVKLKSSWEGYSSWATYSGSNYGNGYGGTTYGAANRVHTNAPAGTNSFHDDKVLLGGRPRNVPFAMQSMLAKLDLNPGMRLSFMPGTKRGAVTYGTLVREELPAVLYHVGDQAFDKHSEKFWGVQPVGMFYGAEGQPTVVCRVKTFNAPQEGYVNDATTGSSTSGSDAAPWDTETDEGDDDTWPDRVEQYRALAEVDQWVPGRGGALVSAAQFEQDTLGGCINCSGAVDPSEAEEIEWVNGGSDFLCPACVQDLERFCN